MTATNVQKQRRLDLWQQALCLLAEHGPATSFELGQCLGCKPQTIAQLLTRQVRYGLVEMQKVTLRRRQRMMFAVPSSFPTPAEVLRQFGPQPVLPIAHQQSAARDRAMDRRIDTEHYAWIAAWQAEKTQRQAMRGRV